MMALEQPIVLHCGDLQPVTVDTLTCVHCGVWLIPVATD